MKPSWYAEVLGRYVGATIVQVNEDTSDDDPRNPFVGITVQMPTGAKTIIWFLGDEEGNYPGVPEIQTIVPQKKLKLNIPHTLDENGNQIKQD